MLNTSKYGIVIQARTSSNRLPGKVLKDILGKPMLQRQIERITDNIEIPLIVATSEDKSDDQIQFLCKKIGVECFRGDLENVVLRFFNCAKKYNITHIIRIGGDDPLIDPLCINKLITLHKETNKEFLYASNDDGWPYGCAAELISVTAIEKILKYTKKDYYLEHTIPFILDNPSMFTILRVHGPKNYQNQNLSLSVDYIEDFLLIEKIFKELSINDRFFSMQEIIDLLNKKPDIKDINKGLHKGFER